VRDDVSAGKADQEGGGGKPGGRSRGRVRPGKRTLAREAAMKTLYLADLRPDLSSEEQDTLVRDSCPPEDAQEYARVLVEGVRSHRAEIDRVITDVTAPNWELRRMAAVDRNIIRLGCFELAFGAEEVPPAVAINEAVGLAKRFGAQNSGSFVNGVLDAIRRRGRPDAPEVEPAPDAAPPSEPEDQDEEDRPAAATPGGDGEGASS